MTEKNLVALGARVEIEMIARDRTREKLTFVVVNDDAADFAKGLLSVNTPLAQTLLGHGAGETLGYARGDIVQVKILATLPATELLDTDAAAQRDRALARAREKAELANMVSFALTFDSKWGDYDPEQIIKQYEEQTKSGATNEEQTS